MARCPDCNKFAPLSMDGEPEINSELTTRVEKDEKKPVADIGGSVRIVLTSECCSAEMKEATFDVDLTVELTKHKDCTCEEETWHEDASISDESGEIEDRQESYKSFTYKRGPKKGQTVQKPIPYRYQKHYYGARVQFSIHCPCDKEIGTAEFYDDVQASGMDELN